MEESRFFTVNISEVFFCPANMNYSDMHIGVVKNYVSFPWGDNPLLDSNAYFDEIIKEEHALQKQFDGAIKNFIASVERSDRWRRHVDLGYEWLYTRQGLFEPRHQYLETERRLVYVGVVSTAALLSHRYISMEEELWPTSLRVFPTNIMGHGPSDYSSLKKARGELLEGDEFPEGGVKLTHPPGGSAASAGAGSSATQSASTTTPGLRTAYTPAAEVSSAEASLATKVHASTTAPSTSAAAIVSSAEVSPASDVQVISFNVKDPKTQEAEELDECDDEDEDLARKALSAEHFEPGGATVLKEIKDPNVIEGRNTAVMNNALAQVTGMSIDSMYYVDMEEEVGVGGKEEPAAGKKTLKRKREVTEGAVPRVADHCYSVLTTAQRNYFFALIVPPGEEKPNLTYYGQLPLRFFPYIHETDRSSGALKGAESHKYQRVDRTEFEQVVAAHVLMYTDKLKAVTRESGQKMDA